MNEVVGMDRENNLDQQQLRQHICPYPEPGQQRWTSPVWDPAEGTFKAAFPTCQQL